MSEVQVPEFIKKFVLDLENSKMDTLAMVSPLCDRSAFLAGVCYQSPDQDRPDEADLGSDCSQSSAGEYNLQSLQPYTTTGFDYVPISHQESTHAEYSLHQSVACTQDINNNNNSSIVSGSGSHVGYQCYAGFQSCYEGGFSAHEHGGHLYSTPHSPTYYDYQVRAESYGDDINDNYDSDGSVELSADIITSSNMNTIHMNHVISQDVRRLPAIDELFNTRHRHNNSSPNLNLNSTNNNNSKGNRGRPVTYRRPGSNFVDSDGSDYEEDDRYAPLKYNTPKVRRGAKNILLWKFLLEELVSKSATHVQWVNRRDGTFKFVDTTECSRRWGQKKNKEDMNFEKLSRGIRHYYRDGLMSRLDGTRLVYKFNWDRVPKSFRKLARGS